MTIANADNTIVLYIESGNNIDFEIKTINTVKPSGAKIIADKGVRTMLFINSKPMCAVEFDLDDDESGLKIQMVKDNFMDTIMEIIDVYKNVPNNPIIEIMDDGIIGSIQDNNFEYHVDRKGK